MTAPQWTMAALLAISLLISANDHGKPRRGSNSFWISLVGWGLTFGILFWGGFWS